MRHQPSPAQAEILRAAVARGERRTEIYAIALAMNLIEYYSYHILPTLLETEHRTITEYESLLMKYIAALRSDAPQRELTPLRIRGTVLRKRCPPNYGRQHKSAHPLGSGVGMTPMERQAEAEERKYKRRKLQRQREALWLAKRQNDAATAAEKVERKRVREARYAAYTAARYNGKE